MAIQTSPHTQSEQNVDSAAMDLEPGMDRTDLGRGNDASLYENSDGAQTGGTRAFNANASRDSLPNSEDVASGPSGSTDAFLPKDGGHGITTHNASEERARQEKVTNS